MALDNPTGIGGPLLSATGTLGAANQIQTDLSGGNSNAQTDLNNISTMLSQVGRLGIGWNYETATTAGATDQSFRFNTADPNDATVLYFHQNSLSGRFDEFIEQFAAGGFIYLQDNTNTGNNFLFQTSALATDEGTYYSFTVVLEQKSGTFTGVAGDRFNVEFLPASAGGQTNIQLPNRFLNEISEQDTPAYTRRVDTEAVIRWWLRTGLVTPSNSNDVGVGIRIDEANGTAGADSDAFEQGSNLANAYIYVSLDDTFAAGTDLNTLACVITENQGQPDERIKAAVNFGQNFQFESALTGVAAGQIYRSNTGFDGNGPFIHYHNNDRIELYFIDTERFFTISEANAPNVDITRGVKNIPESALDGAVQAKLNREFDLPPDDRFKLEQLVEVSTTSTAAALTGSQSIYYKRGNFSADVGDWFVTDFDTGLPPNLGSGTSTWLVAIPHDTAVTSFTGLESGSATPVIGQTDVEIDGAEGAAYDLYTVPLPATASATNFFVAFGTRTTITEIDPTALFKIDRDNVQPQFLQTIVNSGGTNQNLDPRVTALENKVSTLYPLAPDIDILDDWASIYDPNYPGAAEVVIAQGYDLLADYRGDATRYESAGVVYSDAGTNVVTYTGLSESLSRGFGFHVDGPSDQVLMWLVDGSDRIPFIDMTAAGNYRVNNYTAATTAATPVTNEIVPLTLFSGTGILSVGGAASQYTIPDYPAGATVTSRTGQAGFEVLVNGVDTGAEGFITFDVPETDIDQDRIDTTHDFQLGPLHGNRVVTARIGYRFILDAGTYRVALSLRDVDSDITFQVRDTDLVRSYTPASTTTRTDNFEILTDAGGNYTFAGENELLITFHPYQTSGRMNIVPVAIDNAAQIDELNDRSVLIPVHGFEDVEIPDQTALPGFEFRTFRADHFFTHADQAALLANRAVQWVYSLARNQAATGRALTAVIDLFAGTTVGGAAINRLAPNVVYEATNTGTGAGGLVSQVTLPADYTNYDYVHITERQPGPPVEWRNAVLSVSLLSSGLIGTSDNVRLQGDTDLNWDDGTGILSVAGASQEIARVELYSIS